MIIESAIDWSKTIIRKGNCTKYEPIVTVWWLADENLYLSGPKNHVCMYIGTCKQIVTMYLPWCDSKDKSDCYLHWECITVHLHASEIVESIQQQPMFINDQCCKDVVKLAADRYFISLDPKKMCPEITVHINR
jgi:hypothetical protein